MAKTEPKMALALGKLSLAANFSYGSINSCLGAAESS